MKPLCTDIWEGMIQKKGLWLAVYLKIGTPLSVG